MKVKYISPGILRQRLKIKTVPDEWLGKQYDNLWTEYNGPLAPGVYAYVAGEWRNVRKLDPSVLAHV